MTYIATFFSHFGAIRYKKLCEQAGYAAKTIAEVRDGGYVFIYASEEA